MKIIDRKKNLVKLSHGEYVALEKLEAQYKTSKYVANMCIHADSLKSHIIAIVLIDPKELTILQQSFGLDSNEINHEKIKNVVHEDFKDAAGRGNLKGAEILNSFVLVSGEWNPENGLLTAAQKVF